VYEWGCVQSFGVLAQSMLVLFLALGWGQGHTQQSSHGCSGLCMLSCVWAVVVFGLLERLRPAWVLVIKI